jgi:CheY-like chemotaxis protein
MAAEKILIVEDNEVNLDLAGDLLEVAGYEVLRATSAETGLEIACLARPALILMDVGLPGMDGITAAVRLHENPATSEIPVVFLTAHAMKGDEEKARAAGCAGYVTKPIDTRSFARTVASFLGKDSAT